MAAGYRPLTVCIDRLNPPYAVETQGTLQGVTVDLVRKAFASQRLEVEFHPADGPLAQAVSLASGRADVAADLTITARRRHWYRFSRPYMFEELQVFTLRDGPLWAGWSRFNRVLGVKADSYAQEYLRRYRHLR